MLPPNLSSLPKYSWVHYICQYGPNVYGVVGKIFKANDVHIQVAGAYVKRLEPLPTVRVDAFYPTTSMDTWHTITTLEVITLEKANFLKSYYGALGT